MKIGTHRVNVRTIRKLSENDGLTLRDGYPVTYKSGYQVATEGKLALSPEEAIKIIRNYGDCGIWFSNGIYYVDKCSRISTKKEALKIGRECEQISILKWATMEIIYC